MINCYSEPFKRLVLSNLFFYCPLCDWTETTLVKKTIGKCKLGEKSRPSLQDQAGLKSFTIKTIKDGGVRIG